MEAMPTPDATAPDAVDPHADIVDFTYEQARDELIQVVNDLEQGASTLEQSLALWERGEALARRCEQWLIGAKQRLEAARASIAEPDSDADGQA